MDINVTFEGGVKVDAHFREFTIKTDQPVKAGGEGTAPDPFSVFLSSIAACAGFFIARFCNTREISTDGIKVKMTNGFDRTKGVADDIKVDIELPPNFPEKYVSPLLRSVDQCTVKKTILANPDITVNAAIKSD